MIENKKIKLLIITPSLLCGGAEAYVSSICNTIDKEKFNVTLLVVNNTNPFYSISTQIKTIDLKKKRASAAVFSILRLMHKNKFDIVYSTANHINLLLSIFKSFIPKGTKLMAWETSIVSINHKFSNYPKLYNVLLKKYYKKMPLVVCQSKFMQKDLIDNYGFKIEQTKVIYTGVNRPLVDVDTSLRDVPVFLTIARLSPEKQIDRIIESLSLLEFDFKYIVIGDGIERKKLEKFVEQLQLKNKVIFMGQLHNPYEHVKKANLFLMASKYEGLPTSLLEATSLGIPVVAYNTPGGISEIVQDGFNGLLVNDNSVQAFADAIKNALQHTFNKMQIIKEAKEKFDREKANNELHNTLLSIEN